MTGLDEYQNFQLAFWVPRTANFSNGLSIQDAFELDLFVNDNNDDGGTTSRDLFLSKLDSLSTYKAQLTNISVATCGLARKSTKSSKIP